MDTTEILTRYRFIVKDGTNTNAINTYGTVLLANASRMMLFSCIYFNDTVGDEQYARENEACLII